MGSMANAVPANKAVNNTAQIIIKAFFIVSSFKVRRFKYDMICGEDRIVESYSPPSPETAIPKNY